MPKEEKNIYGSRYTHWSAWAWRKPPLFPEWRVYVKYGDSGLECDPGVYAESLDYAITDVEEALMELESLYSALKNFRDNGS